MDREQLTGPRPGGPKTDTVTIDGIGEITVRALSRWEMIHVFKLEHDRHKQEQAALRFGMVDPVMTEDDVLAWQKVPGSAMELELTARKINELSGIGKDAAKSDLPGDGERSDAGV